MAVSQIMFREDKKLLKKLDKEIRNMGFRNRNEWFHSIVQRTVESDEEFFERMGKIARAKGITHEKVIEACREAGQEVYKEEYGDD